MLQEIDMRKEYLHGNLVQTVYFGGGTPSLLSNYNLQRILDSLNSNFSIATNAEVTLEGNPDDFNKEKLLMLRDLGINRLSIGIQSFDDQVLSWMNRAHTANQAHTVLAMAAKAGYDNITLDLIYGTPIGPRNRWPRDIEQALAYHPNHISAYCLTIEPKTAFGNWHKKGMLKEADEDEIVSEYNLLVDQLTASGYNHYEVSNFSLPGHVSVHNANYWKQKPYLGLGPSAHSYNVLSRSHNISNNQKYIQSLSSGELPNQVECLSKTDQLNEYIMTSLRTHWGCDIEKVQKDFGVNIHSKFSAVFARWETEGLATWQNKHIILTKSGLLFADGLAEELFLIDPKGKVS